MRTHLFSHIFPIPSDTIIRLPDFSGNLEMSGNSAEVSEKSGKRPKVSAEVREFV